VKFPYHEFPRNPTPAFPDDTHRIIPLVPIVLRHGDKEFEIDALADSGASSCLFAGMLGLGLGLDVEKAPFQEIYGLGRGVVKAYYHKITLQIGRVVWDEYVGFCFENFRVDGLLGQKGFFSKFRVVFDYQTQTISVCQRNLLSNFLTSIGL